MKTSLLTSALVLQCIAATSFGLASTAYGSQISAQTAAENPIFVQSGLATWYGGRHAGLKTASGEYFNVHQLTAAHRTLPLGTVVRVTDLRTGRAVVVRINDRGPSPHARSRAVLDLSESAADVLNMRKRGVCKVKIEAFASDQRQIEITQ